MPGLLADANSVLPDLPASIYTPVAGAAVIALVTLVKWMRGDADRRDAERSAQRKEDIANTALLVAAMEKARAESEASRLESAASRTALEAMRKEVNELRTAVDALRARLPDPDPPKAAPYA